MKKSEKKLRREIIKDWREVVRRSGGPPRVWRIVLEDLYPANWGESAMRRSLKSNGTSVTAKIIKLTPKKVIELTPKRAKKPRRGMVLSHRD